ncbi:secreted protein [gut metagenome]|uniref:Secreted protein n=1 Tax=gut metagenome TaxID=749906 RepID=J9FR29_9ZZZZ
MGTLGSIMLGMLYIISRMRSSNSVSFASSALRRSAFAVTSAFAASASASLEGSFFA